MSLSTPSIPLSNGAKGGGSHFPGQPFGDKIFQNIQSKPPLQQLEALSSCPIACYVGEETHPSRVVVTVQGGVLEAAGSQQAWQQ